MTTPPPSTPEADDIPQSVVVDASVLVRAYDRSDPGWSVALTALAGAMARWPVKAPLLALWEIGQVVHRKAADSFGPDPATRNGHLARMLADVDLDTPIDAVETGSRTGALVETLGLTFYDAAYVELAQREAGACILLTDDGVLGTRAGRVLGPGRALASPHFVAMLDRFPLD